MPQKQVDSEVMLGQLDNDYELTDDANGADVVVVNTCSFIQSAEESIGTIWRWHRRKRTLIGQTIVWDAWSRDMVKVLKGTTRS